MASESQDGAGVGGRGVFATTHWTLVLHARSDSETGRAALEALCRTYWGPVHSLVRACGRDEETARDLTQEFFARLLSRDGLAAARRERGRFRAFLVRSVKNFLSDDWDRRRAQKRGGGIEFVSLDAGNAEGHRLEMGTAPAPDLVFDREWARELVRVARERLRLEFEQPGRPGWWEVLEGVGDPGSSPLSVHAERLGVPLGTLKTQLRRARLRHAAILRELVAETVASPVEVESELRHLLEVLSA